MHTTDNNSLLQLIFRESSSLELFLISSKSSSIPSTLAKHSNVQNWVHNLAQCTHHSHTSENNSIWQYNLSYNSFIRKSSGLELFLTSSKSSSIPFASRYSIESRYLSRIHLYWVHPLSSFLPPPVMLSPLCLVRDCGMVSAARFPLVALILGACGGWSAKFVTYS